MRKRDLRILSPVGRQSPMKRIGILSDTHGHLDRKIPDLFRGVDHILHAGDIGLPWLILELEDIAPVTAVLGNNDAGLEFKETEVLEIEGRKFLLHHIVDVTKPEEKVKRRIIRENPDVVVFGHTHKRFCETVGQTLYFNPGYAGKQRFNLPRSVAILTCDDKGLTADYFEL
jgi:putative phosphoesterase